MKCLVTGANGALANALCPMLIDQGYEVIATDIDASAIDFLDVRDAEAVMLLFKKERPDIAMHLAAVTDMDLCQKNSEFAYAVNAKGVENIAYACKEVDAELVYISTGAVFDGRKNGPYIESDHTNPLNVYGQTKLAGENFVQNLTEKYYIFRVGWIIGGFEKDKKFVAKIIKLMETEKELKVVNDRFGNPTCVEDFSSNMLKVVKEKLYGLYHLVNKGGCTRYDIALKIVDFLGRNDVEVTPIRNIDYPSVTPRARTEIMINYNLRKIGMDDMILWERALTTYLEKLKLRNLLEKAIIKDEV